MSDNTLDFTINGDHPMDILPGVHGSFAHKAGCLLKGGMVFTVLSDYGDMLFQEHRGPFGSVWLSMYDIRHRARLSAESGTPSVEAMHMLAGNISFSPDGLRMPLTMKERDWQMIHLPHTANKVDFPAGTRLTTLDIHFNLGFLENMSPHFPDLDRFLADVYAGRPATVALQAIPIPAPVMGLVGGLFAERGSEGRQRLYLERHMMDWLASSLESPFLSGRAMSLATGERARVAELVELILSDISFPHTVTSLARLAMMNDFKFKCTFRDLMGLPVHQFIVGERLRKGLGMLQDPSVSLEDIAFECGYESYTGFSKEFKKKYGFPPSFFRGRR